ncbi:hypothetical protein AAC978_12895 [Desulfitobacterium sp. THU1]|uniref:putative ABC transporter permease n=1 Tax=Desulfitobacterium sp. THU1 TaxID=3138072 RepID=UPI00311FA5C2
MNNLDIFLHFACYSFLGWILETIYATIIHKKFVNRGFLHGFFCPIYGFGAVLIILCSTWVKTVVPDTLTAVIVSIVVAVILVTTLEYITGFMLEKIFRCKWWDYSEEFANLHGYICLKYSLLWGGLALVLLQVVHPMIAERVLLIPLSIKTALAALLLLYFLIDTIVSVTATMDLRNAILNYSSLPLLKYYEKIFRYRRIFQAFPRLLILNADIFNRDVRSILNETMDKIKTELKSKFQ